MELYLYRFCFYQQLENVKSPGRHVGAAVTKSSFSYLATHLHILHLSPTVHPQQQPTSLVTSDTLLILASWLGVREGL